MANVEIMSPVGSFEGLTAAIQGGADSIYFGVGNLNMRSRTRQNFAVEDIREVVETAQAAGLKSYIALNTVVYDEEMDEMSRIVAAARQFGVSAIIAADPAVIEHAISQGVAVHMSTQANITNLAAVKFHARYADVMVLARELNLTQVQAITQGIAEQRICGPSGNPVRIEIFIHGALCMAVSGKCYLSLDNYNSSANRGACLQLCRRGYTVQDRDREVELAIENEYIMSPKDLNTVGFLDQILQSGVEILKIEGRGRSPDYVKTVTRVYREAVEACVDGSYSIDRISEWNRRLDQVYNRGFWGGYYLGQKMGEWTQTPNSQATVRKEYVGIVHNFFSQAGVAEVRMDSGSIQTGDNVMFIGNKTGVHEQSLSELRVAEQVTHEAVKGEHCCIALSGSVRRGDKVYKLVERARFTEKSQS